MLDSKTCRILESKIDALKKKDKSTEDRKVMDEVFDKDTLLSLYKLICDHYIETVDYPISTGKEGNVFKGTGSKNNKDIAIKIYRVSNATFRNIRKYVIGDERFKGIQKNWRKLIYAWAQKEFKNLAIMFKTGVNVPKPIAIRNNVLVMSYVGNEWGPAPLLKDVTIDNPDELFATIIRMIKTLYHKGRIVHGDISEYNIMMKGNEPFLIDVGQGVLINHPMAEELLERDLKNVIRYFNKFGLIADLNELKKFVTGG